MRTPEEKAHRAWNKRRWWAEKHGLPFTEPDPFLPVPRVRKPKVAKVRLPKKPPQRAGLSFAQKRLLQRKRGLEIRCELLRKSVVYDGIELDVAQNARELREVQDLLREAA